MSAFSQLIASISKPQAPSNATSSNQVDQRQTQPVRTTSGLVANNAAAGVKRRSEEPEAAPRPKSAKTEPTNSAARPIAPSGRFQLSAKGTAGLPNRPSPKPSTSANPSKTTPKPVPRAAATSSSSPGPAANVNGAPPPRRGFASIMAKAQVAQEAAKTAGASGIKHKPVEKLSRRERARMLEEQKGQAAGARGGKAAALAAAANPVCSNSRTPVLPGQKKKAAEPLSYKGTMKNPVASEPLAYKGTMRKADPTSTQKKKAKNDKYDGYVSWSDLDEAEDEEEEDGYDSEASSDMEGGFDDVEKEEMLALRTARKEDQAALEEEERLKREKLERKRKLQMLSKNAAAKRKF